MEQVEGKTRRCTPKRRSTADEYPKEDLRDASEPSVDAASSEMRSGEGWLSRSYSEGTERRRHG